MIELMEQMIKRVRHKLWFWLICLADRVSPEDAFRYTGLHYRFVVNEGMRVGFYIPGAKLWAQDSDREAAFDNGEYYRE
jgi:hypothetical protein